jgi:hypothetical protein
VLVNNSIIIERDFSKQKYLLPIFWIGVFSVRFGVYWVANEQMGPEDELA